MATDEHISDVFAYGTFLFPKIMDAITGRAHDGQKARLYNFAAFKVKGDIYPGIWPLQDVQTDGVLYHNVSEEELEAMDRYEGEEYSRELLEVETEDGEMHKAWVYIFRAAYKHLLSETPWSPDMYDQSEIDAYIANLKHT
ncbi:MAG: gamma-glutamylcyclotransferase [Gammaproteobacteria bacterium]|nr:gamma-glutamylcyclotransferase [Gammaproteobacteria bacterium]